jgi:competence protein ComFB
MGGGKERPVNLVKLIAEDLLPSVRRKMDIEDTQANREDVLALALNSLPTKYVTSGGGKLYAELINTYKIQYETDVIQSLTKACMKVKNRPRGSAAPEAKS